MLPIVGVLVGFAKVELRDLVKQVGGKWNRRRKVWSYGTIEW
jgi:hypothetical protein